jgi:hypothetical protein
LPFSFVKSFRKHGWVGNPITEHTTHSAIRVAGNSKIDSCVSSNTPRSSPRVQDNPILGSVEPITDNKNGVVRVARAVIYIWRVNTT